MTRGKINNSKPGRTAPSSVAILWGMRNRALVPSGNDLSQAVAKRNELAIPSEGCVSSRSRGTCGLLTPPHSQTGRHTSGFSDVGSFNAGGRNRSPHAPNPILGLLLFSVLAASASAQVMEQPGTYPGQFSHHGVPPARQTNPAAGMSPAPPPPPSPAAPTTPAAQPQSAPSLLDQPPQAAKVEIAGGKLTVQADNSSLTAILNQVSTSAGMSVDGLNKDERIFGTYGPGEPREIISQLLDGSGYNVVMFGKTTAGTPSQVTLSPRGAPLPQGSAYASRPVKQEDEEEEPPPTQYQDNPPPPPNPNPAPGPGAPTSPNGGPRTPQEMLQQLQQQRQQQQQTPQNPQDQP